MVSPKKPGKDMTSGPEWKCLLTFALPIMAGQLLQQLYNTVDGIVVGNYVSSDALAAVGGCTSVVFMFLALCIGMGSGSGIVVSQLFGAGRMDEMRRTASTAMIMQAVLGLFFTVLGVAAADFVMGSVMDIEDPAVRGLATAYFRIYSTGLIFQFVYNSIAGVLRSVGDSKAILYFLLVSTVANTILDVLFVAGFNWGVEGAAAATVLSQLACTAVSYLYLQKRYPVFRFKIREYVFDREKFLLCLRMSVPTSVQHLIISGGNMLIQRLVNSFGTVTMAAFTVGLRFDNYVCVPIMGFMTASASFTGQNIGAGRTDRVERGLRSCVLMDLAFVAVLGSFVYILASPLAALFGVEGEELRRSVECMRFILPCFLIFAVYQPFNGLFQGAGDPAHSMLISFAALSGKVLGAYGMVYLLNLGYASCWQSNLIGWTMGAVVAICHFFFGNWRDKSIINKIPGGNLNEL